MDDLDSVHSSIQESFFQIESLKPNFSSYSIAPTCLYLSKDYSFSKAQRKYIFEEFTKKYPKVDPLKYADDLESSTKKYWLNASGAFLKSKKQYFLSKILEKSQSIPGPGVYQGDVLEKKKRIQGKFSKAPRTSFLSNYEAISEQIPSSFKYYPNDRPKKNFENSLYHDNYFKPPKVKEKFVGPGSYDPEKSIVKQVLNKTIVFPIRKSKKSYWDSLNYTKMDAPPIGIYPGSEEFLTIKHNLKKKKPIISNYKFQRFSETMGKIKQWVPGPGAYNIGPLPKINQSQMEEEIKARALKNSKLSKNKSKSTDNLKNIE